jgi:Aminotransferase class I and II
MTAGLDVSALAGRVSRRPIRAVYVTPHHQFPTTVTLAGPRRLQLLDLASRARFAVIEDDYDHEFHYTGKPVLPLASHDRVGVVAYVGTMSKVLAPGLRLGFIAAPPNLIEQLVAYRSFVDLQGDQVLEAAIADLLQDGLIQRHARKMRRVYRARLDTLATSLRRRLGHFLAFRKPYQRHGHLGAYPLCSSHGSMDTRRAGTWGAVRCRLRVHCAGWAGGRCAPRFRQSYGRGTGACRASARCSCEVSPIAAGTEPSRGRPRSRSSDGVLRIDPDAERVDIEDPNPLSTHLDDPRVLQCLQRALNHFSDRADHCRNLVCVYRRLTVDESSTRVVCPRARS